MKFFVDTADTADIADLAATGLVDGVTTNPSLIADIRQIYDNYDFGTEILVASVRHPIHILEAAKIGADVMTAPSAVIRALFNHPLTEKGIQGFMADWAKTGQSIL